MMSSWLCNSAQAVLTEDDIIKKEVAWVTKTRKAYEHAFYALSHGGIGDDDSRTHLQQQGDRIQLRKQEEEQGMLRPQQLPTTKQQQQQQQQQHRDEKPPTVISISRSNLRGPSTAQLR
jgi:hypothetical protein